MIKKIPLTEQFAKDKKLFESTNYGQEMWLKCLPNDYAICAPEAVLKAFIVAHTDGEETGDDYNFEFHKEKPEAEAGFKIDPSSFAEIVSDPHSDAATMAMSEQSMEQLWPLEESPERPKHWDEEGDLEFVDGEINSYAPYGQHHTSAMVWEENGKYIMDIDSQTGENDDHREFQSKEAALSWLSKRHYEFMHSDSKD